MIYLDNSATTKPCPEAVEAMANAMTENWGNPSALYAFGIDTARQLEGIGFEFPHRFVADWYEWQNDFICNTDLSVLTQEPVYEETAQLSKVHVYKYKELLKESVTVRLYGDRITVDDREFPFETLGAVVVLGKNKLNIYADKELLQMKGSKRFNALKYVNFFHRYQNITGGKNDEFLGL